MSSTPFGSPVVPDEYTRATVRVLGSSGTLFALVLPSFAKRNLPESSPTTKMSFTLLSFAAAFTVSRKGGAVTTYLALASRNWCFSSVAV